MLAATLVVELLLCAQRAGCTSNEPSHPPGAKSGPCALQQSILLTLAGFFTADVLARARFWALATNSTASVLAEPARSTRTCGSKASLAAKPMLIRLRRAAFKVADMNVRGSPRNRRGRSIDSGMPFAAARPRGRHSARVSAASGRPLPL